MRADFRWICSNFLQSSPFTASRFLCSAPPVRSFTTAVPLSSRAAAVKQDGQDNGQKGGKEVGAMSRRLAEMTEETIDSGGRSVAHTVESAGFSEELKKQLEARIADGAFRTQNQRAFSEAEMPVGVPFYFCLSIHFLMEISPPQAKAREIMRLPNHGRDPNLFTTQASECWMIVTNVCGIPELLASLNQPTCDSHPESHPQLGNGLPTPEIEPPSTQPLYPTR